MKTLFMFVLCLLVGITACISANAQKGAQENQAGLEHFNAGRYAEAEEAFRNASSKDTNNHIYLMNVGNACLDQGKIEEACDAFRKSVLAAPEEVGAHFPYVEACFNLGRTDQAIKDLEEIVKESKPKNLKGINKFFISNQAIAFAYSLTGDYNKTIDLCDLCLDILVKTKTERGGYIIPVVTPWFVSVSAVSKSQINLDGIYTSFYDLRGRAYYRLGNLDKAQADFQSSLAKSGPFAESNLGRVLLDLNIKEAAFYLRSQIEKNANIPTSRLFYSATLKINGDPVRAEEEYARAIKNRINTKLKSNFEYVEALAYAHQAWGRYDEALAAYKQVSEMMSYLYWPHMKMGEIYLARGEKELAIASFNRAVSLAPQNTTLKQMAEKAVAQ
ncbi:MAG TPA: tetratricopeptide repeat protein [Candidatus Hydrogenedentes bacterium]|nr:tetratricopeptide repeat protein [Candidatus Hydrogenedentota bacterium]HOS03156.1 tetratricopeptide repeat protein [Candidatus Hydrogenedentota bacterium]